MDEILGPVNKAMGMSGSKILRMCWGSGHLHSEIILACSSMVLPLAHVQGLIELIIVTDALRRLHIKLELLLDV